MNWQERAEKAEAELARLREQDPIKYLYRVTDCFGHDVLRDDPKGATILETIPLYAAPIPAPAAPREYHEFASVMLDAQPFITAETYGGATLWRCDLRGLVKCRTVMPHCLPCCNPPR